MGLTPLQALQAATKWPAETMRLQDQLGTVAAGRFADILIVNQDPLAKISNLQDIAYVIADGRVQETTYHASYWSPFQGEGPITLPVVDDIAWAVNLKRQALAGRGAAGLLRFCPIRQPQVNVRVDAVDVAGAAPLLMELQLPAQHLSWARRRLRRHWRRRCLQGLARTGSRSRQSKRSTPGATTTPARTIPRPS
jgi:hypothetical protein